MVARGGGGRRRRARPAHAGVPVEGGTVEPGPGFKKGAGKSKRVERQQAHTMHVGGSISAEKPSMRAAVGGLWAPNNWTVPCDVPKTCRTHITNAKGACSALETVRGGRSGSPEGAGVSDGVCAELPVVVHARVSVVFVGCVLLGGGGVMRLITSSCAIMASLASSCTVTHCHTAPQPGTPA